MRYGLKEKDSRGKGGWWTVEMGLELQFCLIKPTFYALFFSVRKTIKTHVVFYKEKQDSDLVCQVLDM